MEVVGDFGGVIFSCIVMDVLGGSVYVVVSGLTSIFFIMFFGIKGVVI